MSERTPEHICQITGSTNSILEAQLPTPPLQIKSSNDYTSKFNVSVELLPTVFRIKPQLLNQKIECSISIDDIIYDTSIYNNTILDLKTTIANDNKESLGYLDWTVNNFYIRINSIIQTQYSNTIAVYPIFNHSDLNIILYLPPRSALYFSNAYMWRALGFTVNSTTMKTLFKVPIISDENIPQNIKYSFCGLENSTNEGRQIVAPNRFQMSQIIKDRFISSDFLTLYEGERNMLYDNMAYCQILFNIPLNNNGLESSFEVDILPSRIGHKLFMESLTENITNIVRQSFLFDIFSLTYTVWDDTGNSIIQKTSILNSDIKKDVGIFILIKLSDSLQYILGWDDSTFGLNYAVDTIYASQLSFPSLMKNIVPFPWYVQILNETTLDQSSINDKSASVVGVISDFNTNIIPLKNHILQKSTLNKLFLRIVDSNLEYIDLDYYITLLFKIIFQINHAS